MTPFQIQLKSEQQEVLAAWLPDDHDASVASLAALKERAHWSQKRPQDKDAFARLRALETAASAALWVLRRLPPGLRQKSQLDTGVIADGDARRHTPHATAAASDGLSPQVP